MFYYFVSLWQIVGGKVLSGRSITFVDGVNQMTVEVRVTKESLFSLFKSSSILSTRLAILHLAAVHDKDHDLSRKVSTKYPKYPVQHRTHHFYIYVCDLDCKIYLTY